MNDVDDVVRELLIAGLDDWMYVAQMGSIVRDVLKIPGLWESAETQAAVRVATCAAIATMLERDLVRVGTLRDARFVACPLGAGPTLAQIDSEWRNLGRISLGDIGWCETTSLGKEVGERLLATVGSSLNDQ